MIGISFARDPYFDRMWSIALGLLDYKRLFVRLHLHREIVQKADDAFLAIRWKVAIVVAFSQFGSCHRPLGKQREYALLS